MGWILPSCVIGMPGDRIQVLDQGRTLAEVLAGVEGWRPPDLSGVEIVAVEPAKSAVLGGGPPGPRGGAEGLRGGRALPW